MKRDYVAEILDKRRRLRSPSRRMDEFTRRVFPLVEGFRELKKLDRSTSFRDEWLK